MISLLKRALAEVIGTFFLCFVGIGAIASNQFTAGGGSGLLGVAIAHGLALAIAISALGKVSGGHFNPALSFAMIASRQMNVFAGLFYILAQLAGGTAAGFAIKALFPEATYAAIGGGIPRPDAQISLNVALILEAIATFFLVIAVFGTAVDIKAPSIGGFGIGMTVTFDILAIGPLTGACMNPARAFGPVAAAAFTNPSLASPWKDHALYWVGPLLGAMIAGWVYTLCFLTPIPPPEKPPGSGIS